MTPAERSCYIVFNFQCYLTEQKCDQIYDCSNRQDEYNCLYNSPQYAAAQINKRSFENAVPNNAALYFDGFGAVTHKLVR